MRKKIVSLILSVILLISYCNAESFFPTTDEMFGITMPSVAYAIDRGPSTTTSNDEGLTESYELFTLNDYDLFGRYIANAGCRCDEYTIENGILTISIKKDDATITFTYDIKNQTAFIHYPKNTRPEKEKKQDASIEVSLLPDLGTLFGAELPSFDGILLDPEYTNVDILMSPFEKACLSLRSLYPNGLPDSVLNKLPETDSENKNGSSEKHLTYKYVPESSYGLLSRYLQACGCTLVKYEKNVNVLTAVLEKDGSQFQLIFDNKQHTVEVVYPKLSHIVQMEYTDNPALGGVLPSADEAFGVYAPRPSMAIGRAANMIEEVEPGVVREKYTDFTEMDYDKYSQYLKQHGCNVADYSMENDVLTVELEKDGGSFEFVYDKIYKTAMVVYGPNTRPEATPTPEPTPIPTPEPTATPKPEKTYSEDECWQIALDYLTNNVPWREPDSLIIRNHYTTEDDESLSFMFFVDCSARNGFGGMSGETWMVQVSYYVGQVISCSKMF